MPNALGLVPKPIEAPESMREMMARFDAISPGLGKDVRKLTEIAYRGGFDDACNAVALERALKTQLQPQGVH